MSRKDITRGRALEKYVAGLFGRRRLFGSQRGCDVTEHEGQGLFPIGIECKAWDVLQLKRTWIYQARKNAAREGRPWWAVVQRPKGSRTIYATIDLELLLELCRLASIVDKSWRVYQPNRGETDAKRKLGSEPGVGLRSGSTDR